MRYNGKIGSPLEVLKTKGQFDGQYDLYDIRGLSLGKIACIKRALQELAKQGYNTLLCDEILPLFDGLDEVQTVRNK